MNIFRRFSREIDRLYQDTMSLIGCARRGELPSTPVDPGEVLGPCAHCGKPVRRDEGGRVADEVQVHLTCREADNRERQRILAGYRAFGDVIGSLSRLGNESVMAAVKAGISGLPQRAVADDFHEALRRIKVRIEVNRRIPDDVRLAAEDIISRGFAALASEDVAGN